MAEDPKLALLKWHEKSANLRELMQSHGWESYLGYVEQVLGEEETRLHAIPPGLSGGISDYQRGVIAGLRRAVGIPAEVIKNTEYARSN